MPDARGPRRRAVRPDTAGGAPRGVTVHSPLRQQAVANHVPLRGAVAVRTNRAARVVERGRSAARQAQRTPAHQHARSKRGCRNPPHADAGHVRHPLPRNLAAIIDRDRRCKAVPDAATATGGGAGAVRDAGVPLATGRPGPLTVRARVGRAGYGAGLHAAPAPAPRGAGPARAGRARLRQGRLLRRAAAHRGRARVRARDRRRDPRQAPDPALGAARRRRARRADALDGPVDHVGADGGRGVRRLPAPAALPVLLRRRRGGAATARGPPAGRARPARGDRRRRALRPVRTPAAGRVLTAGAALGQRPSGLAADLLERDGRSVRHGPGPRRGAPVEDRRRDRPRARPRLLPDVLARRAGRHRRRLRRPARARTDTPPRPARPRSSRAAPCWRPRRRSRCRRSRRPAGAAPRARR